MLKHKNIGLFSILVLSMGLVACQPQQAEPKAEPEKATKPAPDLSAKLIGDSEKLKIQLPECDGKSCPDDRSPRGHVRILHLQERSAKYARNGMARQSLGLRPLPRRQGHR